MKSKQLWHTDADSIAPSKIENIIVKNNIVDQFLSTENKHFIVASKGIGKTLLLKYKRFLLERHYKSSSGGTRITFIPESTPYLDFVSDFGSVRKSTKDLMADLDISRKLWTVALMISILSYYHSAPRSSLNKYQLEIDDLKELHQKKFNKYIGWFCGSRKVAPCYVLRNLLSMSKSDLLRFLDEHYPIIEDIFKTVQSGVLVFVDRVDQAIKRYGKEVWIHFQAGLIEAAWDTMRINNHVKVFTSIRQESWLSYSSSDKEAIKGYVSLMRYSHEDLLHISNHHCQYYENARSVSEYIGFSEVLNTFSGSKEDVFTYIQRHTIGRPRDLVAIFSSISPYREKLSEKLFRDVVNSTSHVDIGKNVFSELSFLFHTLYSLDRQEGFLSNIPTNVLSRSMLNDICRTFNQLPECKGGTNCKDCQGDHVFCDLYNAGFLGIVKHEKTNTNSNGTKKQKFLGPYDMRSYEKGGLPSSDNFYLIHPALQDYIEEVRNRMNGNTYDLTNHILVGHNYDWPDSFTCLVEIDFTLKDISDATLKEQLTTLTTAVVHKKIEPEDIKSNIANLEKWLDYSAKWSDSVMKVTKLIEKVNSWWPTDSLGG